MLESLNTYRVVIVALSFLILYLVLRKLLFKTVTEFMENRTKSIKDSIDDAEKAKIEASQLKRQYEDKLHSAKDTADHILNDARIRANKEYESILNTASHHAEDLMIRARAEIERERAQMIKDLKNQVAGLALAAATKVIEANMDTSSNRALVDKFIDEEGAA